MMEVRALGTTSPTYHIVCERKTSHANTAHGTRKPPLREEKRKEQKCSNLVTTSPLSFPIRSRRKEKKKRHTQERADEGTTSKKR